MADDTKPSGTFGDYGALITNSDATTSVPSNYLICDRSGFRASFSEGLVTEWNGRMVLRRFSEGRHPQDFVRAVTETNRSSPRPEQADTFLSTNEVSASDL